MTALEADSAVTNHTNDDFSALPPAPPAPDHPLNPPSRQIAIPAVMAAERGLPVESALPAAAVPAKPTLRTVAQPAAGWRPNGRMDWRWVARQLAAGHTPEAVADDLGCKPSRIRRTLGRSPRFLRLVEVERERRLTNQALRLDRLREELLAGMADQVVAGNPRVMLWLGARLPGFLAEPKFKLSPDVARRRAEIDDHWRTGELPLHWPRELKVRRHNQRTDQRLLENKQWVENFLIRKAGDERYEAEK